MEKSRSDQVIKSLIAPVAVWAVSKILQGPKAKGALREADAYAVIAERKAMRRVRRAGKNALSKPAWLAAGVAAIAVGIGLMAKAASGNGRK
jgi:hypothetical protein